MGVPPPVLGRLAALRRQRAAQNADRPAAGKDWANGWGLVFARPDGRPLDGVEVTKALKRSLKEANLPAQRFHDLRHCCATMLLEAGVPLATIRDVLGHSTIALTANTYAHVGAKLRREAADAIDGIFGSAA